MNALNEFVINKYGLDPEGESPLVLPFDRKGLPKLFRKFGYLVGAEIGVDQGRYSKWICQTLPKAKLYSVDPWAVYEGYVERKGERGQNVLDGRYESAKARLAPYNCEIIRDWSTSAVKRFEDESLDFVYIDASHSFQPVIDDIAEWSKKVRPGGIVAGHDFWNSAEGFGTSRQDLTLFIKHLSPAETVALCQVKDAVEAWTHTTRISPWFVTSEDLPSWLWVKD
jgi:hypothetical protein